MIDVKQIPGHQGLTLCPHHQERSCILTPKISVKKKCIECVSDPAVVKNCGGDKMLGQGDENGRCWFYPYRNGRGRPSVKTIRKFCLECMGGSHKLVADCPSLNCPVHKFRFGSNPNRARTKDNVSTKQVVEAGFLPQI